MGDLSAIALFGSHDFGNTTFVSIPIARQLSDGSRRRCFGQSAVIGIGSLVWLNFYLHETQS